MRTLAIDFGTRRIGLALSDEAGRLATPQETLRITSLPQATGEILKVIAREDVQRIVVGLPLNMDGTFGPAARQVVDWARQLRPCRLPVIFVDERLSSFDAEQRLIERKRSGEKLTRKRKTQQRDALAAASFLQDFLDGKLRPLELPAA